MGKVITFHCILFVYSLLYIYRLSGTSPLNPLLRRSCSIIKLGVCWFSSYSGCFYYLCHQRLCNHWGLSFCLFVCLSVNMNSVAQKVMNGFSSNF